MTHTLDVRGLPHEQKQAKLFPLLDTLGEGETLEVTFEFNPLPLVHMLGSRPDLKVTRGQDGPPDWVLRIEKAGSGPTPATRESLKVLLRELKGDQVPAEARARAKKLLSSVDAKTLGLLEQELIKEGVSHSEIRKSLCDVHLEAMADTLVAKRIQVFAPHPIHTLMDEHRVILDGLHRLRDVVDRLRPLGSLEEMGSDRETLKQVSHLLVEAELHYQREEEALFPRLVRHGVSEPPAIMEEEHVELRARKRALLALVNRTPAPPFAEFKKAVTEHGQFVSRELESHIFKEDNILYQIALQVFTAEDWVEVKRDCDKIGYCPFTFQYQVTVVELDLRRLPPSERHRQIWEKWNALASGGVLRITNDHEPRPLYCQFQAEQEGRFTWVYEQQGPSDWVVRIGRR